MMATYQPQGHPIGAGMQPGGGIPPGHPMALGSHAPNAGQPMQMHHPGVSGPNGPHVSQAGPMVGGIPGGPGMGGPNVGGVMAGAAMGTHALQHLTPQAHLMQMQQQQSSHIATMRTGLQM
ncbi:hypothetical protein BJ546DRAFT_233800 [Cryomyces antarcticus]